MICLAATLVRASEDSLRAEMVLTDGKYPSVYDNPYITAIRHYFIKYKTARAECPGNPKPCDNLHVFRNDSLYADYYNDSFSIIHIWPGQFGGLRGDMIFKHRQDRIFRFWVYKIDTNEYQLKSIDDLKITKNEILDIIRKYGKILFKHSL
jgi:hypothetical protein